MNSRFRPGDRKDERIIAWLICTGARSTRDGRSSLEPRNTDEGRFLNTTLIWSITSTLARRGGASQCPDTDRCCIFLAASSDTILDVFSGLGAGLGLGVLAALFGYSLFPNMMLPTRTLVAPTSIYRWEDIKVLTFSRDPPKRWIFILDSDISKVTHLTPVKEINGDVDQIKPRVEEDENGIKTSGHKVKFSK